MKQLFSVAALLLVFTSAYQQDVWIDTVKMPVIKTKLPVSLGVVIGNNQQQKNNPDVLITPPTTISENNDTVTLYVNNDYITLACMGINYQNRYEYQVIKRIVPMNKQVTVLNNDEVIDIAASSGLSILIDEKLNTQKEQVHDCLYTYLLKHKSGKLVHSLTLRFVLPMPEPEFITFNDSVVSKFKDHPGTEYFFTEKELAGFKKDLAAHTVLSSDVKSLLFRFKALNLNTVNTLDYRLDGGAWKTTPKNAHPFILLENLPPGKHHLEARYRRQEGGYNYHFEIAPALTQTVGFKAAVFAFIIIALFLRLWYWNAARQKRELREVLDKRMQLQNQLDGLQSRLHPHFIFNALNSIQGLINKKDTDSANIYISKFGALLHEIIGKSGQPMHPLAVEIKQLEYYLQLEQLRFKFRYTITIGEGINTSEINIPTMLLQPFVENAVKHGIGDKKEEGLVTIDFTRVETGMRITIADNGPGYDPAKVTSGRGNAMVYERIAVLNDFLKDQKITIDIKGAAVLLYFHNWL